jgi:hypothetical protein
MNSRKSEDLPNKKCRENGSTLPQRLAGVLPSANVAIFSWSYVALADKLNWSPLATFNTRLLILPLLLAKATEYQPSEASSAVRLTTKLLKSWLSNVNLKIYNKKL